MIKCLILDSTKYVIDSLTYKDIEEKLIELDYATQKIDFSTEELETYIFIKEIPEDLLNKLMNCLKITNVDIIDIDYLLIV